LKTLAAVAALALTTLAVAASAQEGKRLDMPAGLQNPGTTAATNSQLPPGINRMLEQNGEPGDPTVIASSRDAPARQRGFDVYNNMSASTFGQVREGYNARLPSGELKGDSRWTMPPPVGVVINQPLGSANENGNSAAFMGFNAGPEVQPGGNATGVRLNARVRVPFGR
jgi:hypothetical protein